LTNKKDEKGIKRDSRDLCMFLSSVRYLLWNLVAASHTILQGLTRIPVGIWTLLAVTDESMKEILKCAFQQGNF